MSLVRGVTRRWALALPLTVVSAFLSARGRARSRLESVARPMTGKDRNDEQGLPLP